MQSSVSVHAGMVWLSVLPIAQASVLRWVLMGGISTNQTFCLAWPSRLCPGVSTASLRFGVGVCGTLPGRGVWGLCLAHCWVLRQQDLFAAMQGGTSGVSFVPAAGSPAHCVDPRVWVVVGGGLVDGVVV